MLKHFNLYKHVHNDTHMDKKFMKYKCSVMLHFGSYKYGAIK